MKLYFKNMGTARRKAALSAQLEKLGMHCIRIEMGEVELQDKITIGQLYQLKRSLARAGFELMDDHKSILVEKIKIIIFEMIHEKDEIPKTKFSSYISERLNHDYTYLANIYSDKTGNTIEQAVIRMKIERVKELLIFNELNLTQISYKLNYSSVAHLSSQFKKITGLTPTLFKLLKGANPSS